MREVDLVHDARNMLHLMEIDLDFLKSHAAAMGSDVVKRVHRLQKVSKNVREVMGFGTTIQNRSVSRRRRCAADKILSKWCEVWGNSFPELSVDLGDIEKTTTLIFMGEDHLKRVLNNLFMNAKDALKNLPHGDVIEIKGRVIPYRAMEEFIDVNSGFVLEKSSCDGMNKLQIGTPRKFPEYLKIIFQDTGAGMNMEALNQVFVRGYSTKNGGGGSGMSIIRRLVSSAGGSILVETTPAQGTRISLFLPIANSSISASRKNVLVVDDIRPVGESLCALLEKLGHCATFTSTIQEAQALLKRGQFDLVLSDYYVGSEVAATLADFITGEKLEIPLLICTGRPEKAAGLGNTLIKPVSIEDLELALAKITKPYGINFRRVEAACPGLEQFD